MEEAMNRITPPPPSLTESAGAAMASRKAGTDHMHAMDDVVGLDEAVNAAIGEELPAIVMEAEVVLENGKAEARPFDGQAIPKGVYAASLFSEEVERTGSWTSFPNVTARLSTNSGAYLGVFSMNAGKTGSIPASPSFSISFTGNGYAIIYVPADVTIGTSSSGLSFTTSVSIIQTGCTITERVALKMRKLI